MSKHTQGPWRVANTRTSDNVLQIPVVNDYGCIAWMVRRERSDLFGDDMANAHLIAAAPEMLDFIADNCTGECSCDDGGVCLPCRAGALIAKAEGK